MRHNLGLKISAIAGLVESIISVLILYTSARPFVMDIVINDHNTTEEILQGWEWFFSWPFIVYISYVVLMSFVVALLAILNKKKVYVNVIIILLTVLTIYIKLAAIPILVFAILNIVDGNRRKKKVIK